MCVAGVSYIPVMSTTFFYEPLGKGSGLVLADRPCGNRDRAKTSSEISRRQISCADRGHPWKLSLAEDDAASCGSRAGRQNWRNWCRNPFKPHRFARAVVFRGLHLWNLFRRRPANNTHARNHRAHRGPSELTNTARVMRDGVVRLRAHRGCGGHISQPRTSKCATLARGADLNAWLCGVSYTEAA